MRTISTASAIFLALATAANASVVNLNDKGLTDGEIVTLLDGAKVKATSNGGGSDNDFAIAFDTSVATHDGDLKGPFTNVAKPGELRDPGMVLAIAEGGCANGFCRPDDNATGGVITMVFEETMLFNGLAAFDFRIDELVIELFSDACDVVAFMTFVGPRQNTDTGDATNDNLFAWIDLGGAAFQKAVFTFGGSGAIGDFDIAEVPLPGAMWLLVSGLAGLGFANSRSRCKDAA